MRVLIVGASGQLGQALTRRLKDNRHKVFTPTHEFVDITKPRETIQFISELKPWTIINCAAYHDAKKCEENPGLARGVNVEGVELLNKIASQVDAKLIHFSTDQVLKSPPILPDEESLTCQYNIYSQTKREGELSIDSQHTVIRVSALYGHEPCRGKDRPNFVEQVIQAIDEDKSLHLPTNLGCSPGYVEDIATVVEKLVGNKDLPPVINLAPTGLDGTFSWFDFALSVWRVYKGDSGLDSKIRRRSVNNEKTGLVNMGTKTGWGLPNVEDSLSRYITKRKEREVQQKTPV